MEHDVVAGANGNSTKQVLWMAMELSLSKWKLGFSDGSTRAARIVTIEARDYAALEQQIARARRAFSLSETCSVRSLYEAGREGFSVHRRLEQMGVENVIVDPASLEVSRHARRAKSDKLDVESLLRHLMAYGANRGRLALLREASRGLVAPIASAREDHAQSAPRELAARLQPQPSIGPRDEHASDVAHAQIVPYDEAATKLRAGLASEVPAGGSPVRPMLRS